MEVDFHLEPGPNGEPVIVVPNGTEMRMIDIGRFFDAFWVEMEGGCTDAADAFFDIARLRLE
jgi:hypothetical protein